jgi:hypothetical protein
MGTYSGERGDHGPGVKLQIIWGVFKYTPQEKRKRGREIGEGNQRERGQGTFFLNRDTTPNHSLPAIISKKKKRVQ